MSKHAAKTESTRAAAAFEEYCAMGLGRGLRTLATHLKTLPGWRPPVPALNTLENWSAAYGWQARVREYDAAKAEERARAREAAIEAMNDRHAQIGLTQQARAIQQIQALISAQKFGSQAAVQLLKLATDLERTARGAPASVERHEVTGKDGGAIQHEHSIPDNPALAAHARALLLGLSLGVSGGPADPSGPGVSGE